jgi:hypothetical protein
MKKYAIFSFASLRKSSSGREISLHMASPGITGLDPVIQATATLVIDDENPAKVLL